MTIPVWQPGATYVPGALVVPRSTTVTAPAALANLALTATTGWDDIEGTAPSIAIDTGSGYVAGEGRFALTAASSGAFRFNNVHLIVAPGQTLSASVMVKHTTNDKHSSDGTLHFIWLDKDGNPVGTPAHGTGLPSLSSSGWQLISLSGTAPANAASAKIGVFLTSTGTDSVYASHLQVNGYAVPVSPRAVMFEATQAAPGKSGSTEPIWPALGGSVQDNQVTWNGVNIDRVVWQASPLLESGDTEPDWPTVPGGVVHDGTVDWLAYSPIVPDANCPHSTVVAIMASKVFAGDKDITRFCATANALDWTTALDAGYLPTGLQQSNSNDMAVLAPYRGNLCAFNASCFQNWQVDPDPAAMALLDQMEGIGSIWPLAAAAVGNELFYLSQLGVRSVSIAAGSDNLQAGDVGMPVDTLVQAALAALPQGAVPRAMYYPGAGQFWLAFPDTSTTVFVFTMNAGKGKWSRYVYPFSVDAFAQLGNDCYIRHGDVVSKIDENAVADQVNGQPVNFAGIVQWGWLDLGNPGQTKMLEAFDIVASGNPSVSFGYDQTNDGRFTTPYAVGPDSVPGTPIPMPLAAPSLSTKVTFPGGQKWSLQSMTLYVDDTAGQP
jgi:hypothetical protein